MKRILKILVLSIALLVTAIQCEEIFEVRLDSQTVLINIPVDSLRTSVATHTFWWEKTYGATQYRMQIVAPSFDSINELLVDEVLDTNKFLFTLDPGIYQWRIRAENSATISPWAVRTLIIDSTLDLSVQTIVLLTPNQKDTTNKMIQFFKWQTLYNADHYTFELWQPDLSGSLVISKDLTTDNLTETIPNTDGFTWRVKGNNSNGSTKFSTRSLYIDTVKPQPPLLSMPTANEIIAVGSSITFDWNRIVDNGSSITDSLIIAIDSNFTQIFNIYNTKSTSITDSVSTGIYYWQVYSKDKAGNTSSESESRKFTVQ